MAPLNPVARQIDPELHAITAWLQRPESDHFLVTSHVNPDGDGLASMLACGRILRRLGKQVWLVTDGFLSPRYGYLPQIDTVVSYREGLRPSCRWPMSSPSMCRPCRVLNGWPASSHEAAILKIDHHPSDDHFGRFNMSTPQPARRRSSSIVCASALKCPSMRRWGPGSTPALPSIPAAFGIPRRRRTP